MKPDAQDIAIDVSDMSFGFEPGNLILSNLNFHVRSGEVISIVGVSGSGKSTLQNLLAGFLHPTTGRIDAYRSPVVRPVKDRFAMSQESSLFPWLSVRQNIELSLSHLDPEKRAEVIRRSLSLVGLTANAEQLPSALSGGMAKRVEVARLMAMESSCIFLDEPFVSLDSMTRETLRQELVAIWRKLATTVVLITHDLAEAYEISDRVFVLAGRPASIHASIDLL